MLGKLERVSLRTIWIHEAQDFTPWLAREENLAELARTIGLELELPTQEQFVGPYRADIVCKDPLTQGFVLIENQLEKTDHSHLGQILTYASGIGAKTIVWVAERFTDEHRAAVDWLNEITDEDFGFFALEIELWKIGDSLPAPKFNVISRPNDWQRTVLEAAKATGEMSERKRAYLNFWTSFRDFVQQRPSSALRSQKPSTDHWTNFAIGRSGFWLAATASTEKQRIAAEIFLRPTDLDPKEAFHRLREDQVRIESEAGFAMSWQDLPEAKGSKIIVYRDASDIEDENQRPQLHEWLASRLEGLERAFRPRIKKL